MTVPVISMFTCRICSAEFPDDTYLDGNGLCGSSVCYEAHHRQPPVMYYSILTVKYKSPFKQSETPPSAPGDQLRVSEGAVLIAIENQPTVVFSRQIAMAYGQTLWAVTGVNLHEDDLEEAIEFETPNEFQKWLVQFIRESQGGDAVSDEGDTLP